MLVITFALFYEHILKYQSKQFIVSLIGWKGDGETPSSGSYISCKSLSFTMPTGNAI